MEHRNDVSALEALISRGFVVDTMEISASWRALPGMYERATAAIRGVEHTMVASAHQSHSYTDGACLYFTFAGKPPAADREAVLPGRVGRRATRGARGRRRAQPSPRRRPQPRAIRRRSARRPASACCRRSRTRSTPTASSTPASSGCASPFGAVAWP